QVTTKFERFKGAIYLKQLTDDQITQYLQEIQRLSLWDKIKNEPELLELARSPLFLNMLVVVYQGQIIKNSQELFNAYIKKQMQETKPQGIYVSQKSPSNPKTLHYLVWLAKQLEEVKESEFLIEKIQQVWLNSSKIRLRYYKIVVALISCLIVWSLLDWLGDWLIGWLGSGLINTTRLSPNPALRLQGSGEQGAGEKTENPSPCSLLPAPLLTLRKNKNP
ncbi:MAG: hypothetical protein AAGF26_06470, partial [Cyanobacteria bacterium P01_G01_bin.49]